MVAGFKSIRDAAADIDIPSAIRLDMRIAAVLISNLQVSEFLLFCPPFYDRAGHKIFQLLPLIQKLQPTTGPRKIQNKGKEDPLLSFSLFFD
jgi:hypothetical protein